MIFSLLQKMIKFGITGSIGLGIDFGLTYFFKEKIKLNKFVANGIGFSVSACSNYYINRIWTFQSKDPKVMQQWATFIGISLIGLTLNTLILRYFTDKRKYKFYFSKVITIAIVFIWNFIANSAITFNNG